MESLTYTPGDRSTVAAAIEAATGCSSERAAKLVATAGTVASLRGYTSTELENYLTRPQAVRLLAAFKLNATIGAADGLAAPLRQPSDAAAFVRSIIGDARQECFLVVGLDARQRVMRGWTVGVGSLAQVDVHPREVFRPLLVAGVHSVILAHNHPSGDPEPGEADRELTKRMAEVGRLVGVPVLDHLVVTSDGYASLAALGLVTAP